MWLLGRDTILSRRCPSVKSATRSDRLFRRHRIEVVGGGPCHPPLRAYANSIGRLFLGGWFDTSYRLYRKQAALLHQVERRLQPICRGNWNWCLRYARSMGPSAFIQNDLQPKDRLAVRSCVGEPSTNRPICMLRKNPRFQDMTYEISGGSAFPRLGFPPGTR